MKIEQCLILISIKFLKNIPYKKNNSYIRKFFNKLNIKYYLPYIFLLQVSTFFVSYRYLFNHQGCAKNIEREFNLFGSEFTLLYPEMCDELFYFHGFQWINHIYENGFVYQDRPLYLAFGFLIYRFLFIFSLIFGFQVEPLSLLLFSSLLIQILIVNLIAYYLCRLLIGKFDKFYFMLFFLFTIFSFENRIYFFLPSSSPIYLLIFIFSLYSIKFAKLNGFVYGLLFTISGYGVIGFLFELLQRVRRFKSEYKTIFSNLILFTLPSIFFEISRITIGLIQGPQYGVKYVHAAEDYQQFIWFINTLFNKQYEPINVCHTLNNFIPCYTELTAFFYSRNLFYLIFCISLFLIFLLNTNIKKNIDFNKIFYFTFFTYLFILFQGLYQYRFIYYSLGFGVFVLTCYFIYHLGDDFISILSLIILTTYTLSRNSYDQFTLQLTIFEIILLIIFFVYSLLVFFIKKNNFSD